MSSKKALKAAAKGLGASSPSYFNKKDKSAGWWPSFELKANIYPDEPDPSGLSTVMKYGILALICLLAFSVRLFAVVRYESVIHEFDPYFNFRTTKYLAHEGFLEFLNWFDDRGWYPLGRTIGGTIYPGLMLTAALFYWVMHFFYITVNIRNVCVFLAPIFSSLAALSSYALTVEVTKRSAMGLTAAAFTAIVPSYISRSVGGSYDNEGVAIFALIFTFYLWVKAVNTGSLMWACFCALSYYYMVAAWGGYVFIINIIPIYVLIVIAAGRYSSRLYIAYSCFYTLGSLMAMTVPFVGFNVINQAESAGAHGVFVAVQVYAVVMWLRAVLGTDRLKGVLMNIASALVGVVAFGLIALQISGKLQWSGRSLTLLDPTYASKYIPIIASVSEHQPTTWTSFFFDLHLLVPLAPMGLIFCFNNISDASIFLILYGTLSWYFAGVMVRLMLTLAPAACVLGAIGISGVINRYAGIIKGVEASSERTGMFGSLFPAPITPADVTAAPGSPAGKRDSNGNSPTTEDAKEQGFSKIVSATLVVTMLTYALTRYAHHSSNVASMAYSSPSIVIDAGYDQRTGRRVLWDDYREAYFWLRQNTHEDSKILSWWDYGYQMSAMANRTVLVDNNTWNNTHIATVGRALASTEEKAYPILESLDVDYVLVIFGGVTGYSSDDINKFLWPVRIGSGVYPNDMPGERDFYDSRGQFNVGKGGSETLLNCVAYKLCYYRFGQMQTRYGKPAGFDLARNGGTEIGNKDFDLETMEEAFTSEHWIVRIYKVKKRPALESATVKPFSTVDGSGASSMRTKAETTTESDTIKTKYIGCFGSEAAFGDKVYDGGSSGANFDVASHFARTKDKRFFATARVDGDGHMFAFGKLSGHPDQQGGGCEHQCADRPDKMCGCADQSCTGPVPAGEQHNRRWSVYEIIR